MDGFVRANDQQMRTADVVQRFQFKLALREFVGP